MPFIIGIILQDNRIIILPDVDVNTFVGFGVFIAFILGVYFIGYRYIQRRAAKSTRWNILLSFLLRQDLVTKEIEIIRGMYQSLDVQTQEELITSKKKFHQLVNDFFIDNSVLEAEERVNIMEKLFPPGEHLSEIKSITDLLVGELCAVESENDKLIGTVVKKWPDQVLISIENFDPLGFYKGGDVSLYCFRAHIGGFMIYGNLNEIGPDFLIFKSAGRVEQKSGHHFMAEILTTGIFKPWPLPTANSKFANHIIHGKTKIYSDRAIIFSAVNEEDVPYYLNHHEIWVFQAKLPSGYVFSCRGIISPSKLYEKSYLFKFLDASEVARNVLYAEIQNFNPVTEVIG